MVPALGAGSRAHFVIDTGQPFLPSNNDGPTTLGPNSMSIGERVRPCGIKKQGMSVGPWNCLRSRLAPAPRAVAYLDDWTRGGAQASTTHPDFTSQLTYNPKLSTAIHSHSQPRLQPLDIKFSPLLPRLPHLERFKTFLLSFD